MENTDNSEENVRKEKESEIIKRALRMADNVSEQQLRQTTRETIFAPAGRKVKMGGREVNAEDLRFHVAKTIENMGSQKTLELTDDSSLREALSIEHINSETSSSQEYFRWLDETSDILKNMNDGFVTEEDLKDRNAFLDLSHQREAELMVCLGLLQHSKSPQAQEEFKKLQYKLTKLREMRSAIKNRTRNQVDVEISRSEYETAVPYYKYFKALRKLPFGYDLKREQKRQAGLEFDDDDDDELEYYDSLLNVILDQMEDEDRAYIAQEYQLAKDLSNEDHVKHIQNISDKLQELSGRKNSFRVKYDILNQKRAMTLGNDLER